LENTLAVDTFVHLVKAEPRATLSELFPPPDELCASGPEGAFTHELVVPIVRGSAAQPVRSIENEPRAPRPRTRFGLGSEWLYVKLFTGTATADAVLVDVVAPAIARATECGAALGWFFIRFGDPDWHLRVRVHGVPERLMSEVLPE